MNLDPDFCEITGIEDGCLTFSFNFQYFDSYPKELDRYAEEFKTKYEKYKSDKKNNKWQEIEPSKSLCIKIAELVDYPVAPFTGIFEEIYAIEDYKQLKLAKTELENYLLLVAKIPYLKESGEANNFGMIESVKNDFTEAINSKNGILENPLKFLKSAACMISAGAFDDLKTELCIPVTRLYLKKYFTQGGSIDFDKRLRLMNIAGGMKGFNLDGSHFFEDSSDNIDITVRYKLELPIPFRIIPSIEMEQRAVQRAWTSGDAGSAAINKNQSGDIWSLGNLERGQIIRQTFGANLPFDFPVIASFYSGTATMIKSMDTTAAYYQNSENLKEKVMGYIKELKDFKGGKHGSTEITEDSISQRNLKLVIPENSLTPDNQAALDECTRLSAANGIQVEVIRYQEKKVNSTDDKK
jgi:hypothetical protein